MKNCLLVNAFKDGWKTNGYLWHHPSSGLLWPPPTHTHTQSSPQTDCSVCFCLFLCHLWCFHSCLNHLCFMFSFTSTIASGSILFLIVCLLFSYHLAWWHEASRAFFFLSLLSRHVEPSNIIVPWRFSTPGFYIIVFCSRIYTVLLESLWTL